MGVLGTSNFSYGEGQGILDIRMAMDRVVLLYMMVRRGGGYGYTTRVL